MDNNDVIDKTCSIIKEYLNDQHDGPFLHYKAPAELQQLLQLDVNSGKGDWSQLFTWIEKYLAYSVKTNNPGFVNRMWVGANLPSMIGEMITASSNTSSCTYESAPVATLMEQYMIREMLELVGFSNGEGQMTTGSSNGNLVAMICARNETNPEFKTKGVNGHELHGYVSGDAHYSMEKAANVIGLGTENLKRIPVDDKGSMDTEMLEKEIKKTLSSGATPFFVGGTAGTTVRGGYDPIASLVELRDRYGFWLHIDGAWGGAVIVSDRLRRMFLEGIGKVDSFTFDFHKMLGTALMCNVLLINNRSHTLGRVLSGGDDSYIFHGAGQNEVFDPGAVSLQCGRRVDSLKWFLDWKYFGRTGFAAMVDKIYDLSCFAEGLIHDSPELELVFPRSSFNICFRYKAREDIAGGLNLTIRDHLYKSGHSLVGYAESNGRYFLRLLLANSELTEKDVQEWVQQITETGKSLEVKFK